MKDLVVWDEVSADQVTTKPIPVRWVDVNKGDKEKLGPGWWSARREPRLPLT